MKELKWMSFEEWEKYDEWGNTVLNKMLPPKWLRKIIKRINDREDKEILKSMKKNKSIHTKN